MPRYRFNEQERAHLRSVYDACAALVDDHLEPYVPARDDTPKMLTELMGLSTGVDAETTRYSIIDQPTAGTLPGPYSRILESAGVIAFQKLQLPESGIRAASTVRKVELLDPFRSVGGATLLLLSLQDHDLGHPEIPGIQAHGEAVKLTDTSPLFTPESADDILHMVTTIRGLSEAGALASISFDDIQAMYSLQSDLENE